MAVVFKLPDLGENITSAEVVSVAAAVGDMLEPEQTIIEVETDKAVTDVPAPIGGKLVELAVAVGDKLSVGDIIAKIEEVPGGSVPASGRPEAEKAAAAPSPPPREADSAEPPPAETSPAAPVQQVVVPEVREEHPIQASPSVRKFAREIGVDISQVVGSGPVGRISIDDVKSHARRMPAGGGRGPTRKALPDFRKWGDIQRKAMSNVRKKTALQMETGWNAPHVTLHDKADVTALEQFRQQYKATVEKAGGKLTITAMLLRIVSTALKRFPALNCSIDMSQDEVIYKQYVNVGVAADTPRGLVVPVILNADQKTVTELSVELTEMAARAGRQTLVGRDGGRYLHDHEFGRHRDWALHPHHQRSRSCYTGDRTQQLRTGVHRWSVPAASDDAPEPLVRSSHCRRR